MSKRRDVEKTGVSKRCCRCKTSKDTSEFHRTVLRKDGLQAYCRDCKKVIDKEPNVRNPRRNYRHRREYALRNLRWLHDYLKSKQCEWEGCTINDPDMLVLDHLNPHDKRHHISTMAHGSFSLKSLQDEVAKCRVLCANHHQKHTIQQFGYKKWVILD